MAVEGHDSTFMPTKDSAQEVYLEAPPVLQHCPLMEVSSTAVLHVMEEDVIMQEACILLCLTSSKTVASSVFGPE